MWDLGYTETRIRHRLSIPLTAEQNKHTNSFSFYIDGKKMLDQPMHFSILPLTVNSTYNLIGKSYLRSGELINLPMDFSNKNYFNILEQHSFLQQIIFPKNVNRDKKLYLRAEDFDFLYEWMSKLPRESKHPFYLDHDKYPDGYCKFFMFGDSDNKIPDHIRIYNKVGMAYGFLTDNAYVVDTKNNIELFLTASVVINWRTTVVFVGSSERDSIFSTFNALFLPLLKSKVVPLATSRETIVNSQYELSTTAALSKV